MVDFRDRIKTLQEFCEMTKKQTLGLADHVQEMKLNVENYETLMSEFTTSITTR